MPPTTGTPATRTPTPRSHIFRAPEAMAIPKLDRVNILFHVVQRFGHRWSTRTPPRSTTPRSAPPSRSSSRSSTRHSAALRRRPLLADLPLAGDRTRLRMKAVVLSVHDPCSGSLGNAHHRPGPRHRAPARHGSARAPDREPRRRHAPVRQEVDPDICKSDLFMISADSSDAEPLPRPLTPTFSTQSPEHIPRPAFHPGPSNRRRPAACPTVSPTPNPQPPTPTPNPRPPTPTPAFVVSSQHPCTNAPRPLRRLTTHAVSGIRRSRQLRENPHEPKASLSLGQSPPNRRTTAIAQLLRRLSTTECSCHRPPFVTARTRQDIWIYRVQNLPRSQRRRPRP